MRHWVLAVLVLLSGCTSPPDPTQTTRPTASTDAATTQTTAPANADEAWSYDSVIGDSWRWEGRFTFNLAQAPPADDRVWNARVAAFENVTVPSGTYAAVRRDSTVTLASGEGPATTVTSWARKEDYALLMQVVTEPQSSHYPVTTTTTWRQPCPEYQWPMSVGDTWTTDCTADVQSASSGTSGPTQYSTAFHLTTRYVVESTSETTVDGKRITTYRLNETLTGDVGGSGTFTRIVQVSPGACGDAVTVVSRGMDRGEYELTVFQCAATAAS